MTIDDVLTGISIKGAMREDLNQKLTVGCYALHRDRDGVVRVVNLISKDKRGSWVGIVVSTGEVLLRTDPVFFRRVESDSVEVQAAKASAPQTLRLKLPGKPEVVLDVPTAESLASLMALACAPRPPRPTGVELAARRAKDRAGG